MQFENIIFDVADGVATITFNRPEAANAMNLPLMKELMQASIACDEDASIRAVLVTGFVITAVLAAASPVGAQDEPEITTSPELTELRAAVDQLSCPTIAGRR